MAALKRKPFQGVTNIIRFNRHFYIIAFLVFVALICTKHYLPVSLQLIAFLFIALSLLAIIISLSVSFYIYDLSDLYTLNWLNLLNISAIKEIININAGFDETSALLAQKYPGANLKVFDFYDPARHTEISIERARKAYPPFTGTKTMNTNSVALNKNSADVIFLILAAHEIRQEERVLFFKQLGTSLTSTGKIIVVEHQRDAANFIAYNFGFFHFHSHKTWLKTFKRSGLTLEKEIKLTPFISTFILNKNGAAS